MYIYIFFFLIALHSYIYVYDLIGKIYILSIKYLFFYFNDSFRLNYD